MPSQMVWVLVDRNGQIIKGRKYHDDPPGFVVTDPNQAANRAARASGHTWQRVPTSTAVGAGMKRCLVRGCFEAAGPRPSREASARIQARRDTIRGGPGVSFEGLSPAPSLPSASIDR